jgi:hypothetical protein
MPLKDKNMQLNPANMQSRATDSHSGDYKVADNRPGKKNSDPNPQVWDL